jgi:hypothetical protein
MPCVGFFTCVSFGHADTVVGPTVVPIFNIDKRPFALLCVYNGSDHTKHFVRAFSYSWS